MPTTAHKKRKSELALWEMEAPRSVNTVNTNKSGNNKSQNIRNVNVSQSVRYHNAQNTKRRQDRIYRDAQNTKRRQDRIYRNTQDTERRQDRIYRNIQDTERRQNKTRNTQNAGYTQGSLQMFEMDSRARYQNADMDYIYKRRKARRRRAYFYRSLAFAMLTSCVVLIVLVMGSIFKSVNKEDEHKIIPVVSTPIINEVDEDKITEPDIMIDLLEINDYSRPATELNKIKSIFVHYTANPRTSAKQNRSYFANLGETHERSASAHFIIGYEGEIIQCIPLEEQAYAVMTRNDDSISIECCYLDEDGKFTQETYDSLVHLLAWLCQEYNLESEDILRHYDCGGKLCPLYYVENEDKWDKLIRDVELYQD